MYYYAWTLDNRIVRFVCSFTISLLQTRIWKGLVLFLVTLRRDMRSAARDGALLFCHVYGKVTPVL